MEIWKFIEGYEGIYQISNKGNVRSVARTCADKNGKVKRLRGKAIKPTPNSSGYLRVQLRSAGGFTRQFVHRLVAFHFIPNSMPIENTVVNHIDSNFLNNDASNLEWTTYKGNMQHALKKGRLKRTEEWLANMRKAAVTQSKGVIGYDPITGKTFVEFDSIQECGRNGYDPGSVCECCKGRRKTHKGLAWEYRGGDESGEEHFAK